MPSVTRKKVLPADPDRVYDVISDPRRLTEWWPRVTRVESIDGKPGTSRTQWTNVLAADSGRKLRMDYRCIGATRPEFVRELADFGLVAPKKDGGRDVFDETDMEIVRAGNELARSGVAARNLKVFKTSADREVQLIEALLAPKLISRNPQRRKEAVESLERMASVLSELKHALLVRDLRRLADT